MTHQYKQAGNSVVVPVIERIASNIAKVLCENSGLSDEKIENKIKQLNMLSSKPNCYENNSEQLTLDIFESKLEEVEKVYKVTC